MISSSCSYTYTWGDGLEALLGSWGWSFSASLAAELNSGHDRVAQTSFRHSFLRPGRLSMPTWRLTVGTSLRSTADSCSQIVRASLIRVVTSCTKVCVSIMTAIGLNASSLLCLLCSYYCLLSSCNVISLLHARGGSLINPLKNSWRMSSDKHCICAVMIELSIAVVVDRRSLLILPRYATMTFAGRIVSWGLRI